MSEGFFPGTSAVAVASFVPAGSAPDPSRGSPWRTEAGEVLRPSQGDQYGEAVDFALQYSRKLKAASADERVMVSMRKESSPGFSPGLGERLPGQPEHGRQYLQLGRGHDGPQFPAVRSTYGQDANFTVMWPIFSGAGPISGTSGGCPRGIGDLHAPWDGDRGRDASRLDYIAVVRPREFRVTASCSSRR